MPSRNPCSFTAQKMRISTLLLRDKPGHPAPLQNSVTIFFRPKWGIPQDKKYPKKYKNAHIWRKRKHSHTFVTVRQGHTKHVCQISGPISQTRRGQRTLDEFGPISLNQPVLLLLPVTSVPDPKALQHTHKKKYVPAVALCRRRRASSRRWS